MRLAVRKKWQIQARSGNCVYPIMMDDCKCGKTITHCVVVTPLSPVNGPLVSRFLAHAQYYNRTTDLKTPVQLIISYFSTNRTTSEVTVTCRLVSIVIIGYSSCIWQVCYLHTYVGGR